MKAETIRRFTDPGRRKRARAYYTVRELARITTAGGRLSAKARVELAGFYKSFPDLPEKMPIFAHNISASYSGSGYSADTRVLAEVPDEELIASAARAEDNDRIGQSDVWQVFVRNNPERAFRALMAEQRQGRFEAHRWQPLLTQYSYQEPVQNPPPLPDLIQVITAVISGPDDAVTTLAYTLTSMVERRATETKKRGFPAIWRLWGRLISLAAQIDERDHQTHVLSEIILSHPLANLASALVRMQSSVKPAEGSGFTPRFRAGFNLLARLGGRPGVIARAAMIRELAFLHWLAPHWVDRYLFPMLDADSDDAIDLMSVVSVSDAPQYAPLFNRLKGAIVQALEHEKTDAAARERLSNALVSAALAVIRNEEGFDLSSVECRRVLTRMPNAVLASMAWELSTILLQIKDQAERATTWTEVICPFLVDYWPNDVSARTADVSDDLAKLPGLAGCAFEKAVDVVLGLVQPAHYLDLRHGLALDEANDPVATYPRAALRLITSVVDRNGPLPRDVSELIRGLEAADSKIASEPAFWRLRQLYKAN